MNKKEKTNNKSPPNLPPVINPRPLPDIVPNTPSATPGPTSGIDRLTQLFTRPPQSPPDANRTLSLVRNGTLLPPREKSRSDSRNLVLPTPPPKPGASQMEPDSKSPQSPLSSSTKEEKAVNAHPIYSKPWVGRTVSTDSAHEVKRVTSRAFRDSYINMCEVERRGKLPPVPHNEPANGEYNYTYLDYDGYMKLRHSTDSTEISYDGYCMPDQNLEQRWRKNAERDILRASKFIHVGLGTEKNESWEEPLCLINIAESGTFSVVPGTLQKLKEIDGPVVVISIFGRYRSGKSFLLNKIFKKKNGFKVSPDVKAETKGIWVWRMEPLAANGPQILVLDTEGLGDAEKACSRENDLKIFVLTSLISTCMIYNSQGVTDQTAIDNLKFVSEMSSKLSLFSGVLNANSDENLLGMYFPQLIWVLRDFTLDLKGKSSDEYLEDIMMPRPGYHKEAQEYNATRYCIRIYFPDRKFFVFPLPVAKHGDYISLSKQDDSVIISEFKNSLAQLTKELSKAKPKNFNGMVTDGQIFACMVQHFANALAADVVANVEIALNQTVSQTNNQLLKTCVENYKKGMDLLQLPTRDRKTLLRYHNKCSDAVLEFIDKHYKTIDADQDELFQKQLKEALEIKFSEICRRNEKCSIEKCRKVFADCMSVVLMKIANKDYMKPGGYKRYEEEFNIAVDKYKKAPGKGLMETAVFTECFDDMSAGVKSIIEVDNALSKLEKQNKEQRLFERMGMRETEEMIRLEIKRQFEEEIKKKFDNVRIGIQTKFDEQEQRMLVDAETLLNFLSREQQRQTEMGCTGNAHFLKEFLSTFQTAVVEAKKTHGKKKDRKAKIFRKPYLLTMLKKQRQPPVNPTPASQLLSANESFYEDVTCYSEIRP